MASWKCLVALWTSSAGNCESSGITVPFLLDPPIFLDKPSCAVVDGGWLLEQRRVEGDECVLKLQLQSNKPCVFVIVLL
ncbi:hypothetical protein L195_g058624, partial [Trifolium pratense]